MAFSLIQAGTNLLSVNSAGALSSPLTLPNGVSLANNLVPRFAKYKQYIIVVNTPSRPISVDTSGIVRVLTPMTPTAAVSLSAGAAGQLSGGYLALQTFLIRDSLGNTIAESGPSPLMSGPFTVSSQELNAAFQISPDNVSAARLYRSTTNGSTYFQWRDVDGNFTTSITNDNTPDASLGIVAIANLGAAPDLTLIAEWQGRVFGVTRSDVDDLRWTEPGTMYAWYQGNTLPIPHIGSDAAGITSLIPRRHALGVTRRDTFLQVTGVDTASFSPQPVFGGETMGCLSQESVVVFNDVAYFLWRDGVYTWSSEGIKSITNGRVRSWFSTPFYFNRAMFWRAFATLDPFTLKYRLFLASAGSSVIDSWIEYDLPSGSWYGPHKTAAFNPTCALYVPGNDMQPYSMIGSQEGYLSLDQQKKDDWGVQPIHLSVTTKQHALKQPDYEKYFGELSVMGEANPGTLTVTPTVGEFKSATPGTPFACNLAPTGRARLGRIGVGKQASLTFDHNVIDQDVVIEGYEINPVSIVGRR